MFTLQEPAGQLYETAQEVGVGLDHSYISGLTLPAEEILMFLGEIATYYDFDGRRRQSYKFLYLKDNSFVWISQAWIEFSTLRLIPCDD